MKKQLIIILTFIFIFILSSCEKKDNIGRISSIEIDNIKNEFEFEEGIKSYVYISDSSRRVYYYFGLKDGFKVVIDDSFLSEQIFYKRKYDETDDEYQYNSSLLETPDKIYDYNYETKELSLTKKDGKEIISNDKEYDMDSILNYLSEDNNDNLIDPNFMIKAILADMSKYSFIHSKGNINLYDYDMAYYNYLLKQENMRIDGSKYFDLMKEKYLTEEEYDIFIDYIHKKVLNPLGSIGYFDVHLSVTKDITVMYPEFCMLYEGSINIYIGDENRYFFNVDLLNKYSTIFDNLPYY